MNIVLLIAVTLARTLVRAKEPEPNREPCLKNPNNNANNQFVQKHILQQEFDRKSKVAWEKYLEDNGLWRRRKQSFFNGSDQGRVNQICNGKGRQFDGNLCISDLPMEFYYLEVDQNYRVTKLSITKDPVVVACDKIGNQCLPVHFEKYNNKDPPLNAKLCSP